MKLFLTSDPFVTVDWLKGKLDTDASSIRLVDCQWHLPHTKRVGSAEYKQSHIPGAVFFDLDECSDKDTDIDHMLPKPEFFAAYVGNLGISNSTHVVLYDNNDLGVFSAPRMWWMFRVFGHADSLISIVNGGFPAWCRAGYPCTDEVPKVKVHSHRPQSGIRLELGEPIDISSAIPLLILGLIHLRCE